MVYLQGLEPWGVSESSKMPSHSPERCRCKAHERCTSLHGMQANATRQMVFFGRIEQYGGVFRYTLTKLRKSRPAESSGGPGSAFFSFPSGPAQTENTAHRVVEARWAAFLPGASLWHKAGKPGSRQHGRRSGRAVPPTEQRGRSPSPMPTRCPVRTRAYAADRATIARSNVYLVRQNPSPAPG